MENIFQPQYFKNMRVKISRAKKVVRGNQDPQGGGGGGGGGGKQPKQPENIEQWTDPFVPKPPQQPQDEEDQQNGGGGGQQGMPSDEEKDKKEDKEKGKGEGDETEEKSDEEGEGKGGAGEEDSDKEEEGKGKGKKKGKKKPKPIQAPNGDNSYEPNQDEGKTDEQLEKEQQDKLTKAHDQTLRENPGGTGRGTGSGSGIGKLLNKNLLKTKTDWKTLLKSFIGGLPRVEQTWNRPSSRYWAGSRIYMPSEKLVKDTLDLVVAIDTSGSISFKQIHTFLNEVSMIVSATKRVKLKVLFWMDNVYNEMDVDSKTMGIEAIKQKLQAMKIENDGGTTISSVKSYLEKKQVKKIEGIIYFTDGRVESNPTIPKVQNNRILFLITPGGDENTLKNYGRTVEVDIK